MYYKSELSGVGLLPAVPALTSLVPKALSFIKSIPGFGESAAYLARHKIAQEHYDHLTALRVIINDPGTPAFVIPALSYLDHIHGHLVDRKFLINDWALNNIKASTAGILKEADGGFSRIPARFNSTGKDIRYFDGQYPNYKIVLTGERADGYPNMTFVPLPAGAPKPSPVAPATVQPTAPAYTVQPTAPAYTVQPTAPAYTVQPTAPAATVQPADSGGVPTSLILAAAGAAALYFLT